MSDLRNVFGAYALTCIVGGTGCATQSQQAAITPEPDPAAIEIVHLVKESPTLIQGGGMVYELYMGEKFNARVDEREGSLVLTDFATQESCRFGVDGTLVVPDGAEPGYASFCQHLSTNAYELMAP